jgi:RNA polymerase I-specific transcription initiation factor RRN7
VELYPAVQALINLQKITFSFSSEAKPSLIDFPEIKLMASLVVAIRVYSGLGINLPGPALRPSGNQIDWKAWQDIHNDSNKKLNSKAAAEVHMQTLQSDVYNMSGADIDKYLDWYAKLWTDNTNHQRKFLQKILLTRSA